LGWGRCNSLRQSSSTAAAADLRSDIYSLAATIYMALTVIFPFGQSTVTSMMMPKVDEPVRRPIQKVPTLRPAVDAAIRMRCMQRQVSPRSVTDFVPC